MKFQLAEDLCVPGTVLEFICMLAHFKSTTVLGEDYVFHLTEETEAQSNGVTESD